MGDVSDRLEVKVVAARGLGEVEGGDCNPFALVRCGAEEERTAVASATSSAPEWNASTMIFTDVADAADDVVVAVMHKALSAARDQALGRAVISLRTCFQAVGVEQDDWFPLEDADGRACGEVRLELAYFVDADDDFPEDDSDDEAAGGGEPNMVRGCVEINQCDGCTRKFFTKSFLGDDAAVPAPSGGDEPAPPRHRAGVASMVWRTTRRFSTNAP